jgi:hypothetical protein
MIISEQTIQDLTEEYMSFVDGSIRDYKDLEFCSAFSRDHDNFFISISVSDFLRNKGFNFSRKSHGEQALQLVCKKLANTENWIEQTNEDCCYLLTEIYFRFPLRDKFRLAIWRMVEKEKIKNNV